MTMQIKTTLAGIVGLVWFGSYIVKGIRPEMDLGLAPDALMTTVTGWWFNEARKEANATQEE
jgi:hypothetical protein